MPYESLIFQIGILLGFALVLGWITSRIGISSLVGQILAGVIAGPILGLVHPDRVLEFFSFLGLMMLVFLIGIETKIDDVKKDVYTGISIAAIGALLTFIAGMLLGTLLFGNFDVGLAIGVALISTSTAIPIKILMDKKIYQTYTGKIFVIMAIADDVIAILAMTLLFSYLSFHTISMISVASLFLAVLGFIFFILTFGDRVINSFISHVQRARDPEILFTVPLIIAFLVSIWSENIGLAAITGAFITGIAMSRSYFRESIIQPKIMTFGYCLVIPIFFAYSSIFVDLGTFLTSWQIILIILAVGAATKAIGSGLAARWFGFNKASQRIIALGMIPRGEYGIVISQLALTSGIISNQIYTVMISFILLTVLITPILFEVESRIK